MSYKIISIFCLSVIACSANTSNEDVTPNTDSTSISTSAPIPEEKKQFFCLVDGEDFTFSKMICNRNPDFSMYNFSFYGTSASITISLSFDCEKKTVPFAVEIPIDGHSDSDAKMMYDKVPDPYFISANTNSISVTEWNTTEHFISLDFKGKLTNLERTDTVELEGYLNQMPYAYFE